MMITKKLFVSLMLEPQAGVVAPLASSPVDRRGRQVPPGRGDAAEAPQGREPRARARMVEERLLLTDAQRHSQNAREHSGPHPPRAE